jgi:hypothetical protein
VQHTGAFMAEGSDGKTYAVNVFTNSGAAPSDSVNSGTLTDRTAAIDSGPRIFQTTEGLTLSWVSKGVYKILQTGAILRSDSPDAP